MAGRLLQPSSATYGDTCAGYRVLNQRQIRMASAAVGPPRSPARTSATTGSFSLAALVTLRDGQPACRASPGAIKVQITSPLATQIGRTKHRRDLTGDMSESHSRTIGRATDYSRHILRGQ